MVYCIVGIIGGTQFSQISKIKMVVLAKYNCGVLALVIHVLYFALILAHQNLASNRRSFRQICQILLPPIFSAIMLLSTFCRRWHVTSIGCWESGLCYRAS